MTSTRLWTACLVASVYAHFLLLGLHWGPSAPIAAQDMAVPVDLDAPLAARIPGAALWRSAEVPEAEEGQNDELRRRRLALKQFLEDVRKAIEARKFQPPDEDFSDMIGNVTYVFTIRSDDSFGDVRMTRSSGNARLDRTAALAIRAASGVATRPKILGGGPIRTRATVKYQYSM